MIYGCANQAGEDNRNVAHMATLLAGYPHTVPGTTLNRLCGSGLDAVGFAARAIKAGDADLLIAGGVESMSRAPFVMGKASAPYQRQAELFDTTIGWRFVNPLMAQHFGTDSMPETAENVAELLNISRADQMLPGAASSARRRPSATAFWRRRSCRCRLSAGKGRLATCARTSIRDRKPRLSSWRN